MGITLSILGILAVLAVLAGGMKMAEVKSTQATALTADPVDTLNSEEFGGRVRAFRFDFSESGGVPDADDTVLLTKIPKGHTIIGGWLNNSISLGTSTPSIGTRNSDGSGTPDPDSLRKALVKTSTTPEIFGDPAGSGVKVTQETDVYWTNSTAVTPSGAVVKGWIFTVRD